MADCVRRAPVPNQGILQWLARGFERVPSVANGLNGKQLSHDSGVAAPVREDTPQHGEVRARALPIGIPPSEAHTQRLS